MYLFGVASIITFFHILHSRLKCVGWLSRFLGFLGQYSLVSYIGQMGLIKLWLAASERFGFLIPSYIVNFSIILAGTVLVIVALDWATRKSPLVKKAYRYVFG